MSNKQYEPSEGKSSESEWVNEKNKENKENEENKEQESQNSNMIEPEEVNKEKEIENNLETEGGDVCKIQEDEDERKKKEAIESERRRKDEELERDRREYAFMKGLGTSSESESESESNRIDIKKSEPGIENIAEKKLDLNNVSVEAPDKSREKSEVDSLKSDEEKLNKKIKTIANNTNNTKRGEGENEEEEGEEEIPTMEQLLMMDRDLTVPELRLLNNYVLQQITVDWLESNNQFFDYEGEPYLFHLETLLSKYFENRDARTLYSAKMNDNLMVMNLVRGGVQEDEIYLKGASTSLRTFFSRFSYGTKIDLLKGLDLEVKKNHLDVYSPFRLLAKYAAKEYNVKYLNSPSNLPRVTRPDLLENTDSKVRALELIRITAAQKKLSENLNGLENDLESGLKNSWDVTNLITETSDRNLNNDFTGGTGLKGSSQKMLGYRFLKKDYNNDDTWNTTPSKAFRRIKYPGMKRPRNINYLNFYSYNNSFNEFKPDNGESDSDTEETEEESKKVFMIINSFGGAVGNGVTVHDALQFVKAGSLTLGLGVAASAASLALGGGTIGERYLTEGCHVMIHQPEGEIKGQASDVWVDSQEIMRIRMEVAEIYSISTYRPQHKILHDLDRDFYLTAKETIAYGLADEVATDEVTREIIESTGRAWKSHDQKQERLLEVREEKQLAYSTQTQH